MIDFIWDIEEKEILNKWPIYYKNIKYMRKPLNAPVDNFGAHTYADSSKNQRLHVLIALMLSSQTKDEVTASVMKRIKNLDLSLKDFINMPINDLEKLLYPVGFYKTKAKYIKNTAKILNENFDKDVPTQPEDFNMLPGVGLKMTHLAMQIIWQKTTGIAVDTHLHRLANRLQLVPKPTKTPEKTRKALESWLPKEYWSEINHLMVGFGQMICKPIKPKCSECLNSQICPYFKYLSLK